MIYKIHYGGDDQFINLNDYNDNTNTYTKKFDIYVVSNRIDLNDSKEIFVNDSNVKDFDLQNKHKYKIIRKADLPENIKYILHYDKYWKVIYNNILVNYTISKPLQNKTGWSCFLNSTTQILLNIPEFMRQITQTTVLNKINNSALKQYIQFLDQISRDSFIQDGLDNKFVNELLTSLSINCGQNDAGDFLSMLFIQFDPKNPSESINMFGMDEIVQTMAGDFIKRSDNVTSPKYKKGEVYSEVKIDSNRIILKEEIMNKHSTMSDIINEYFIGYREQISDCYSDNDVTEYYRNCERLTRNSIKRTTNYVFFSINRFVKIYKNNNLMKSYIYDKQLIYNTQVKIENNDFELISLICCNSTINSANNETSGHYWTYCKAHFADNRWRKFDDGSNVQIVEPTQEQFTYGGYPTMLVYKRKDHSKNVLIIK
jgi:hypothetical protein